MLRAYNLRWFEGYIIIFLLSITSVYFLRIDLYYKNIESERGKDLHIRKDFPEVGVLY